MSYQKQDKTLRIFGEYMKRSRKNAGITQAELASALKITQGSLSKFENGFHIPDTNIWLQFCSLLNIPFDPRIAPTESEFQDHISLIEK